MTPREINAALDSMIVLVDTREQDTPRLRARLRGLGCEWRRVKLDYGDYSAEFTVGGAPLRLKLAVERKMDFTELAQCFCKGRARFAREFKRAENSGGSLVLLIEEQSIEDAYAGNYRSQMSPRSMVGSLLTWTARYHCPIFFVDQRKSCELIHDILYYAGREMLEGMLDE